MKLKNYKEFILESAGYIPIEEALIEDPEIAAKLGKYYELQTKRDELKSTLANLEAEIKGLGIDSDFREMFDSMKEINDRLAKSDEHIVKITRFSGTTTSYRYKEAFELALSKLNKATQNVLNESLEMTKKVSNVKHSFNVEKIHESVLSKFVSKVKGYIKSFLNIFKKENKNIKDANLELEKIAKSIK